MYWRYVGSATPRIAAHLCSCSSAAFFPFRPHTHHSVSLTSNDDLVLIQIAALGSPLFLVKARIQAYSPALPVGAQHHYSGSLDALNTILRSDGVLGLWRGVNAALLRTAMVSRCERRPKGDPDGMA